MVSKFVVNLAHASISLCDSSVYLHRIGLDRLGWVSGFGLQKATPDIPKKAIEIVRQLATLNNVINVVVISFDPNLCQRTQTQAHTHELAQD